MDNNNFNYDSDPADCNIASSNNPSEFNTESAEEFPQTPAEFATDTESAVDSETSDTESATDNSDATDFFNSPGIIAPLGTAENTESAAENDISELYESQDSNTEAGSDNGCGCGCGDDGCDIGGGNSGSDCGYGQDCEYSEEFGESNASPEDETAATVDELYSTTAEARENCRLDDYEIISDVLGSEKQLVKQ